MHTPSSPSPAASRTTQRGPSLHAHTAQRDGKSDGFHSEVGAGRHSSVGRVVSDLAAERTVSDQECRQHALDCAWLMERSHDLFTAHGSPADRDEAVMWMHRQHEALRALSPAWKAAQQAGKDECYFGAAGAMDRTAAEGGA